MKSNRGGTRAHRESVGDAPCCVRVSGSHAGRHSISPGDHLEAVFRQEIRGCKSLAPPLYGPFLVTRDHKALAGSVSTCEQMGDLVKEGEDPSRWVVGSIDSNQGCEVIPSPESPDVVLAHGELQDQDSLLFQVLTPCTKCLRSVLPRELFRCRDSRMRALESCNPHWILTRPILAQMNFGRALIPENPRCQLLQSPCPANLTGFFGAKFVVPKSRGAAKRSRHSSLNRRLGEKEESSWTLEDAN